MTCKSERFLYNSLKKYGVENHKFIVIIQGVRKDIAVKIEKSLIAFYKQNKVSLNIQDGGFRNKFPKNGEIITDRILQFNLTGVLIDKWDCLGDIVNKNGCLNTLISNACRIGYRTNYAIGYLWQHEADYLKGVPLITNPRNKAVVQFLLTGEYIKTYPSSSFAARESRCPFHIYFFRSKISI